MKLIAWLAVLFVGWLVLLTVGMMTALSGAAPTSRQPIAAVDDIPVEYVELYVAAGERYGLQWWIIAAIGSVETDHGRSTAAGVHSGVNFAGCCAGPMQFSVVGSPSTWDSYGAGGDAYDPADAIPAAARYLRASGAPRDWHAAILAYNHSEAYYQQVMTVARRYEHAAPDYTIPQTGEAGPIGAVDWLADVPGTHFQCDRRIVNNVAMILDRFHAQLTACYAPSGHAAAGEHPLGLAVDLVPAPPASWDALDRLARWAGWRTSCASTGCAGQTHTAFRFVGWGGYPGHGAGDHLHLSWDHGPGLPASSVKLAVAG